MCFSTTLKHEKRMTKTWRTWNVFLSSFSIGISLLLIELGILQHFSYLRRAQLSENGKRGPMGWWKLLALWGFVKRGKRCRYILHLVSHFPMFRLFSPPWVSSCLGIRTFADRPSTGWELRVYCGLVLNLHVSCDGFLPWAQVKASFIEVIPRQQESRG